MIRNAFNGGELSPQVQMRGDLEVYARGCRVVENFDIGQAGGVSRRRGFRFFAEGLGEDSRLFVYDAGGGVQFLVEVNRSVIRVLDNIGLERWRGVWGVSAAALVQMRTLQVNSILLFMSNYSAPMQLVYDGAEWSFGQWVFKVMPWRQTAYRQWPVAVSCDRNGVYNPDFSQVDDAMEQDRNASAGDTLRVSYYTEAAHVSGRAAELFARVTKRVGDVMLEGGFARAGDVVSGYEGVEVYYSCTADFNGADMFVVGLDSPENYQGNFQLANGVRRGDVTISALSKELTLKKGQVVRYVSGYHVLYTCVKDFDWKRDGVSGMARCEDYPGYFTRGMLVGSAPCKGAWKFYCSGTWYGSYEVRASYDGTGVATDAWEYRAESWSQLAAPSNTGLGGDESNEECYVSLWLTRVRAYGEVLSESGFPPDGCVNELVVSSYKHDIVLQLQVMLNGAGVEVSREWVRLDKVRPAWSGRVESEDWSWGAFSGRYGYPRCACIYNQRLVFAGTLAQPMTIWASQTDDIDNFDIIEADNSAMALTLSGETMDPIRWMEGQSSRIVLGTSRGEYVVEGASGSAMTYANACVVRHGFCGAADVRHLQCEDKVIYIGRGAGRAKQYGYNYEQDAYLSTDLTVFAEHVLQDGGGVRDGCVLAQPHPKAVFVLRNGQLALMTYNSMHQVHAWHRYTTHGEFLAVAAMPRGEGADRLFALVKRTVDDEEEWMTPQDVVCIEVMDDESGYADGIREWDYTSTLVTNALTCTKLRNSKEVPGAVMLYFASDVSAEGVEVTVDGGASWARCGHEPSGVLKKGWHMISGYTAPGYDVVVGFRVSGAHGMDVLALQG